MNCAVSKSLPVCSRPYIANQCLHGPHSRNKVQQLVAISRTVELPSSAPSVSKAFPDSELITDAVSAAVTGAGAVNQGVSIGVAYLALYQFVTAAQAQQEQNEAQRRARDEQTAQLEAGLQRIEQLVVLVLVGEAFVVLGLACIVVALVM